MGATERAKPRKGTFIADLDLDTREVLRIRKPETCTARAHRLGGPAEREVCGGNGHLELGDGLWVCRRHSGAVIQDAAAVARAGQEQVVLLSGCVFPALRRGLSAPLCGEPAVEKIGSAPACARHYKQALAWHREVLDREKEAERQMEDEYDRLRELEMQTWNADGSQIVYYLRRADGAIKIGTSANFASRFRNLTREHGELEIMLTHCGDHPRENRMHKQFADLAIGGEWFQAGEPLLTWIIRARRKRANMTTVMPGTVPLRRVLALLREAAA